MQKCRIMLAVNNLKQSYVCFIIHNNFTIWDTITHLIPIFKREKSSYPLESLELYCWPQRRYILKEKRINSLTFGECKGEQYQLVCNKEQQHDVKLIKYSSRT